MGLPIESTKSALNEDRMTSVLRGAEPDISLSIACSRACVRISSSWVSCMYSLGGFGASGGGGGGATKGTPLTIGVLDWTGGDPFQARFSESYIAFSRAFSSAAVGGRDPEPPPGGIGVERGGGVGIFLELALNDPERGGVGGGPPLVAASCASNLRRSISFSTAALDMAAEAASTAGGVGANTGGW